MSQFPEHHVRRGITTHRGVDVVHTPTPFGDPTDTTLPQLVEALGGADAYATLPILDLESCAAKGGGTGYIDFVMAEDMSSAIMRGRDDHGRPFLALRFSREVPDYTTVDSTTVETTVETLFRRYTAGPIWTSGGSYLLCDSVLKENNIARVASLVATGSVTFENWEGEQTLSLS